MFAAASDPTKSVNKQAMTRSCCINADPVGRTKRRGEHATKDDSLDGNDSLVATFLESGEPWLRGEMIDFIGN